MPAKVIHRVEYRNVCSQRCERPKQKCLLPITFDAKRPHRSVAMIIVLDKSGSMGGVKIVAVGHKEHNELFIRGKKVQL